jgi:RNA polymerase sigma-70 factor, ECF subfamily
MNETPANQTPANAGPADDRVGTTGDSSTTDERLMLEFTLGSSEAFNELFRRYKQPIYGFFRRRVADPAHAEELSQETWVVVLRAASRYQPRALFRTYLYAVAFKILRAARRKANFRALFLGRPSEPSPDPAKPDPTESGLWVRRAVAKLEPLDREIVLLREFEQLSYAEIADLLRLPLNTVRSRLFRARTALRDLLEPPATAVAESASAQNPGPATAPFIAQKRNPA